MSLEDLLGGSSFGALSPYDDPREFARYRANQGLLGLSAGLLAGSGPSRLPVGLGQALGQGLLGMQQFQRAANEDALNSAKVPLYKAQAEKTKTEVDLVKAQTQEALRKAALTGNLGPALMQFITGAGGSGSGAAAPGGTPMSMSKDGVVPAPEDLGNLSDPRGKVPVIMAAAQKYNVDPTTALRVAKSEGLATFLGDGGKSGGAFQLYTGGGVGNEFQRDTGLNPLDPKNEDATIDYAMRHAAENGWGAWNGAKRIGITGYMGIGKEAAPTQTASASPIEQFNSQLLAGAGIKSKQVAQADTGTATDAGGGDVSGALNPGIPSAQLQGDASRITNSFGPPGTFKMNSKGMPYAPSLDNANLNPQFDANGNLVTRMGDGKTPLTPERLLAAQLESDKTRNPLPADGMAPRVSGQSISVPPPQPMPAQFAQQQAAAAPPAAAPQQLMPGGAAFSVPGVPAVPPVPAAPNMDPRRMAAMGAMAQLGGLPDVMKPFETYYYGSPGYKGQVAGAEAAGKYPYDISQEILKQRLAAALAGPTKKAQEEVTYPFTIGAQMSQGDINRESERLKQVQAAGLELGPLTIGGNTQPATRQQQVDWTTKGIRPPQFGPAPGPAAPGQAPALATPQSGTQVLTKAEEGRVAQQAAGYDKVSEDATAAEKGFAPLTALHNAMLNFRTGPGRETQLNLTKTWQTAAEMLGAKPDSDLAKWIASGEIIKKEGTSLGFELARTLGSRESQMIIQQAIATNPGLANSVGGNEKLIEVIQQGLQRELDKRTFYDNWFNAHGHSYEGAAGAFQKAAPAEQYISKALPFQPKDKDAYDALRPGSTYIDPTGVTRLKPYSPEWSAHMPQ